MTVISDPSIPLASVLNATDFMLVDQVDASSITGYRTRRASGTLPKNDVSSITGAGALAKFYNPIVFGAAALGNIERFNRVFMGGATASSGDILSGPPVLPTTPCWLDSLTQMALIGEAQLGVLHTWGGNAIVCASASLDYRSNIGSTSGGAFGILAVGNNNDLIGSPVNLVAGGINAVCLHQSGCQGVSTNQFDVNSLATTVDVTAFGGIAGGQTFALGLTPGAYGSLATHNASAALWIGPGDTTAFRKGIILLNTSLDTSVGAGGNGVAVEMARNMSILVRNSGGTVDSEMWGNASGWFINNELVVNGASVATLFGVGANQVVGARRTGWTVATGTPSRATFATASVTLPTLAGVVMALEQDLIAHGLIGT